MAFLEMQEICKYFPESNVTANDHVDFSVEKSEIHAIVGENGAGKTTLMRILYGLEQADTGRTLLNGSEQMIRSPLDADRLGIGMVHQHFRLVPEFTVAENVTLGIEPKRWRYFLDQRRAEETVTSVMTEYGFDLDPAAKVSQLAVGQKQQVEILRVLYRNDSILILDEPTSVLTEQQSSGLFASLRYLTSIGRTVILITHKLDEVMTVADRVTVMRAGRNVAVRAAADVNELELSKLMVGKSVSLKTTRSEKNPGENVFKLENVTLTAPGDHRPRLENINLKVRGGEIVGIAGVSGNGLAELEEAVTGLRAVTEGSIYHRGTEVAHLNSFHHRERGLAYVPADRLGRGSSGGATVIENIIVSTHHRFIKYGMINRSAARRFGRQLLQEFEIKSGLDVPIGSLSGGNIQKVILARELAALTDFVVFSEPGWGLDVASTEFMYRKILECREKGVGILLVSSNLDEILALADRLVVMFEGRIVGRLKNHEHISKELIGEYMLGIRDDTAGERHHGAKTADRGDDSERLGPDHRVGDSGRSRRGDVHSAE